MNNSNNNAIDCNFEGFEGPEKRLEITISPSPIHKSKGLRSFSKDKWQELLDLAKCTIISVIQNDYIDSYVLSESSLFVYSDRIMLKTCGTTTLLNVLDKFQEMAKEIGSHVEFITFSRKNFNFPEKQCYPHGNFESEVKALNTKFVGSAHILGPVLTPNSDHHFVYFSEREDLLKQLNEAVFLAGVHEPPLDEDDDDGAVSSFGEEVRSATEPLTKSISSDKFPVSLEILMSELSPMAMRAFFKDHNFVSAKQTTTSVGLASLLPNMQTDEVMFEPCGYSVNAINQNDGSYFTVHVTPEDHCSFVSFETNFNHTPEDRKRLIEDVVDIFRPRRFSVVITSADSVVHPKGPVSGYSCRFRTQYEYEEGFHVKMMNYSAGSLSRKTSRAVLAL